MQMLNQIFQSGVNSIPGYKDMNFYLPILSFHSQPITLTTIAINRGTKHATKINTKYG